MKENARVRFYLDKTGFFAESAMIFLALAVIFRVIGCWILWTDRVEFIMLLLLPACCCVLMILCILLFGKKGFFLSFIPVLLGVVFFVYKSLSFTSWLHTVLCILLYLVVAVIYTATVFGWIHTKWLLPPLFGLPFLYHVFVEDIPALTNTAQPVTFTAGMEEMSVLGIMAALFCVGMGLKKRPAKHRKREEQPAQPAAEPVQRVPSPAPAPAAPVPEAASIQSAAVAAEPEANAILSDASYTPVLTLDPEPWEPEPASEDQPGESEHE